MRLGLALLLVVMAACTQTKEGDGQAAPAASGSAKTQAAPPPAASASASASARDIEAHIPREAATKIIDLIASAALPDASSSGRQGEVATLERATDGGPASARLFGLTPESPAGKAGLLNGDRVLDINGVPAGDPKERWDSVRQSNKLILHVLRRGAQTKIMFIVE